MKIHIVIHKEFWLLERSTYFCMYLHTLLCMFYLYKYRVATQEQLLVLYFGSYYGPLIPSELLFH